MSTRGGTVAYANRPDNGRRLVNARENKMTFLIEHRAGVAGLLRMLLVPLVLCAVPPVVPAQNQDAGVARLVDALTHEDALHRRDAAEALGNLGAAAAPAAGSLVAAWDDDDSAVRRQSVAAVKKIGMAAAESARDRGADLQQDAALQAVVDALITALEKPGRSDRVDAISIVKAIGDGAERTYPVMLRYMEDDDAGLRVTALEALNTGSRADYMRYAREQADRVYARKDEGGVRAYRIMLILLTKSRHRFSNDEMPAVIRTFRAALQREEPGFRRYGAEGLGELRAAAAPAIPDLVAALDDEVYDVYEAARDALERIGVAALPALTELLRRDDVDLRRFAAEAIGRQGKAADQQVDDLLRVANDNSDDAKTRAIAIASLGRIGLPARAAVPDLMPLLEHGDASMRLEVVRAVGMIDASVSQRILNALQSRKPSGGNKAPIANADADAEQIRETSARFTERLGDDAVAVRRAAAEWLGKVLNKAGRPLTQDDDTRAALILRTSAEQAVSPLLRVARSDSDLQVRVNAVTALGELGAYPKQALPAVVQMFGEGDASLRSAAAKTAATFGPQALEYLHTPLQSGNEQVRNSAIAALTTLARVRKEETRRLLRPMIPTFIELIGSGDNKAVLVAVNALVSLGPDAAEAVQVLAGATRHADKTVRAQATAALGAIGAPAVGALSAALESTDMHVRQRAIRALGNFGTAAKPAIPALAEQIERGVQSRADAQMANLALDSVAKIANSMLKDADTDDLSALRGVNDRVAESAALKDTQAAKSLNQTIELLDILSWGRVEDRIRTWVLEHPVISAAVPLYILWVLFWWLMLYARPLALLQVNRALAPLELTLPERLGGMTLPVRYVFFVGFLNYRPAVLDAWVRAHITVIRERFAAKETVHDREVHVPVPVEIDRRVVADLRPKHLRGMFAKQLGFLLIWGEGGSGKTSLACRVGRRALSDDPDERIGDHPMVPVLLEHEPVLRDGGNDSVLIAVAQQLQDLCDLADPVPAELLQNLLRQRRVLVIIDHLSEMRESTREIVQQQLRQFRARALIVTSRLEEDFEGFSKSTVRPLRIAGNRLSSFMEAYLTHRGMRELFEDSEFFRGCSHLSAMVGDRDITALFAKLYAEEMVSAKRGISLGKLPENIPDLMLSYVNELNQAVREDRIDDRTVHRCAKLIAWECLRKTFRPDTARYEDVISLLNEESAESTLRYLEQRLRLVHAVQPAQDQIRFMLDPMAEYFAAMYLVESNGEDEERWRAFLDEVDAKEGGPDRIKGFLVAVFDCGKNYHEQVVPAFVGEQIAYRAGLETSDQTSRRPRVS